MWTNLYRLPSEETLTDAKLNEFIIRHSGECAFRYSRLQEAYETEYPILHEPLKPKWKPDNRIMVNFAKYIVDTMNGFFYRKCHQNAGRQWERSSCEVC